MDAIWLLIGKFLEILCISEHQLETENGESHIVSIQMKIIGIVWLNNQPGAQTFCLVGAIYGTVKNLELLKSTQTPTHVFRWMSKKYNRSWVPERINNMLNSVKSPFFNFFP